MYIHQHDTSLSRWIGHGQASGNSVNGHKAYVLKSKEMICTSASRETGFKGFKG